MDQNISTRNCRIDYKRQLARFVNVHVSPCYRQRFLTGLSDMGKRGQDELKSSIQIEFQESDESAVQPLRYCWANSQSGVRSANGRSAASHPAGAYLALAGNRDSSKAHLRKLLLWVLLSLAAVAAGTIDDRAPVPLHRQPLPQPALLHCVLAPPVRTRVVGSPAARHWARSGSQKASAVRSGSCARAKCSTCANCWVNVLSGNPSCRANTAYGIK